MDLSVFSPVCLPGVDENFVGQKGHVYGKKRDCMKTIITLFYLLSIPGWGDTGLQETSTDKLQETVVPIVETGKCGEDVDGDLIICAGGLDTGPCKVTHQRHSLISNV